MLRPTIKLQIPNFIMNKITKNDEENGVDEQTQPSEQAHTNEQENLPEIDTSVVPDYNLLNKYNGIKIISVVPNSLPLQPPAPEPIPIPEPIPAPETTATDKNETKELTPEEVAALQDKYFTPGNLKPEDFTVEALTQAFPEDKYEIWSNDDSSWISVVDNQTYESVYSISQVSSGDYWASFGKDGRDKIFYRPDGTIKQSVINSEKVKYTREGIPAKDGKELAQDLYDAIYETNALGIPETAEELKDLVKEIVPENVNDVLQEYQRLSNKEGDKQGLIDAIFEEIGFSASDRVEMVKHITEQALSYAEYMGAYTDDLRTHINTEIGYEQNKVGFMDGSEIDATLERLKRRAESENGNNTAPDGQIGDFEQGNTGDCWLLSSIKAIANNPKGLEILNNMLSVDEAGNVTVTLQGKEYLISKEELWGARELAQGDLDVRALEIAVDRYLHENHRYTPDNDLTSGVVGRGINILIGDGESKTTMEDLMNNLFNSGYDQREDYSDDVIRDLNEEFIEKIQNGDAIVTVATGSEVNNATATNNNGDTVGLVASHAYAVVGADEEYVYFVNPHNSQEILKMSHEEFSTSFKTANISYLDGTQEEADNSDTEITPSESTPSDDYADTNTSTPSIPDTKPEQDFGDVNTSTPSIPDTKPEQDFGDVNTSAPSIPDTKPEQDFGDVNTSTPSIPDTKPEQDFGDVNTSAPSIPDTKPEQDFGDINTSFSGGSDNDSNDDYNTPYPDYPDDDNGSTPPKQDTNPNDGPNTTPDTLPPSSTPDTPSESPNNPDDNIDKPDFGDGSITGDDGSVFIPNQDNQNSLNVNPEVGPEENNRTPLSEDEILDILNDASDKYGDQYNVEVNEYGDILLTPQENSDHFDPSENDDGTYGGDGSGSGSNDDYWDNFYDENYWDPSGWWQDNDDYFDDIYDTDWGWDGSGSDWGWGSDDLGWIEDDRYFA